MRNKLEFGELKRPSFEAETWLWRMDHAGDSLFEEMLQSEDDQEGLGCTLVEKRSREHRGRKEKGGRGD